MNVSRPPARSVVAVRHALRLTFLCERFRHRQFRPTACLPATCKTCCFALRNVPFCRPKQAILRCETGRLRMRIGTYGKSRRQRPFLVAYLQVWADCGYSYTIWNRRMVVLRLTSCGTLPRSSWELADEHKNSRQSPFVGSLVGIARAASGTRTRTTISGQGILSPSCLPIPPLRQQVRLRVCKGIIISCNGQIFP